MKREMEFAEEMTGRKGEERKMGNVRIALISYAFS